MVSAGGNDCKDQGQVALSGMSMEKSKLHIGDDIHCGETCRMLNVSNFYFYFMYCFIILNNYYKRCEWCRIVGLGLYRWQTSGVRVGEHT